MFPEFTANGKWMLIAGAALLYAAGRAAVEAIAGSAAAPFRRAIAYCAPVAAVVAVAIILNQPAIATAVLFSTSVASLALVGGCIAILGNTPAEPPGWPQPVRRPTAAFLPASILILLAGFSAHLGWFNIIILTAQGLVLWLLWLAPADAATTPSPPRTFMIRPVYLLLAAILMAAGACSSVQGILNVCRTYNLPAPAILATIALSPLLVAPMLLGSSTLSQRGQAWAAHATHIAFAQINLFLLLPLAAIAWRLRWRAPLMYPLANWRVEAVVLILLAAAFLPAAGGRWRPAKFEGAVLLFVYVAYILGLIAVSARS